MGIEILGDESVSFIENVCGELGGNTGLRFGEMTVSAAKSI